VPQADRTPDRPGPGPVPDAVLRSLDLAVLRRIQSLVPGDFTTPQVGAGTELATIRPYQPGDDVRHIDWNVTARMREPHVRVHVGERALTAWLVLDVSPSMAFGSVQRRKLDVAEGVALALGHVSTRRGNRLGVLAFGDEAQPRVLRPQQGRVGLLALLAQLRAADESSAAEPRAGGTTLTDAVGRLRGLARARGLIVLVSDFRGPRDWETPLRTLRARHGVLAVEIRDPREDELVDVGEVWFSDPETGGRLRVNTSDASLRTRFAEAAAEERRQVAAGRLGVVEDAHDLGARHAVDRRVVDLREDAGPAALEAVDHVELPQRARAVERPRHDPRDLLGELRIAARLGERQLADVVVEVEVGVVDPVRVVEAERHLAHAPAQRRQEREPVADQRAHLLAAEAAARRRRGVEDRETRDVPGVAAALQREELRVEASELPQLAHPPATSR